VKTEEKTDGFSKQNRGASETMGKLQHRLITQRQKIDQIVAYESREGREGSLCYFL
jgi:hypothetical protein